MLEIQNKHDWVEPFLMVAIMFFVLLSLSIFGVIIYIRQKKIKVQSKEEQFKEAIEEILFKILFDGIDFNNINKNFAFRKFNDQPFFRNLMMRSIIDLHKNYDGLQAVRLEAFYRESGLIEDSIQKMKDHEWEVKCMGVVELSEMNIKEVFEDIARISLKTKNKILKITAINACIKLDANRGILHLTGHRYRFDVWTQVNILDAITKLNIEHLNGIDRLLISKNKSVVSLGLKIIKTFQLAELMPEISNITASIDSQSIKKEGIELMEHFQN
ncbi:MAG: hypothetical protein U0V04_07940 [Spirosomataceae bacterium]|jgi:hypothetical protein